MVLVVCHTICLALAVGIYERNVEYVLLGINATVVTERERPVIGRVLDGSPEVNYLEALFEEFRRVGGGEVTVHTRDGGGGGLVNMSLRNGLVLPRLVFIRVIDCATVPDCCTDNYILVFAATNGQVAHKRTVVKDLDTGRTC